MYLFIDLTLSIFFFLMLKLHALVEYDTVEAAEKAVSFEVVSLLLCSLPALILDTVNLMVFPVSIFIICFRWPF